MKKSVKLIVVSAITLVLAAVLFYISFDNYSEIKPQDCFT